MNRHRPKYINVNIATYQSIIPFCFYFSAKSAALICFYYLFKLITDPSICVFTSRARVLVSCYRLCLPSICKFMHILLAHCKMIRKCFSNCIAICIINRSCNVPLLDAFFLSVESRAREWNKWSINLQDVQREKLSPGRFIFNCNPFSAL